MSAIQKYRPIIITLEFRLLSKWPESEYSDLEARIQINSIQVPRIQYSDPPLLPKFSNLAKPLECPFCKSALKYIENS
jgi:hypothetical protein